jgi:hypothetical protein
LPYDYKQFLNAYDMIIKNDGDLKFPNAFIKYCTGADIVPEVKQPRNFTTKFVASLLEMKI